MRTPALSLLGSVMLLTLSCARKREAPLAQPSASAPPPPTATEPPPPSGEVLARKYVACSDAFNRDAFDELGTCYAQGAVSRWTDSGFSDETGPSAIVEQRKRGFKRAFPDAKVAPQLVLVNGLELVSTGVLSGTHRGPFATKAGVLEPTKKAFGQLAFSSVRFDQQGLVVDDAFLSDRLSLLFQLGTSRRPARPRNTQGLVDAPRVITATGDDTERSNVEAVAKRWRAFAEEDRDALGASLAEDIVLSDQLLASDTRGKAKALEATEALWSGLGKLRVDCPTRFAARTYVVSVCRLDATSDGPLLGLPPTGRPVSFTVAEVARLEGGLTHEIFRFADGARLLGELGAEPLGSAGAPGQVTP
jgi:predicted ester cyclase